jgi:predicted metal-dependent hydrolase
MKKAKTVEEISNWYMAHESWMREQLVAPVQACRGILAEGSSDKNVGLVSDAIASELARRNTISGILYVKNLLESLSEEKRNVDEALNDWGETKPAELVEEIIREITKQRSEK